MNNSTVRLYPSPRGLRELDRTSSLFHCRAAPGDDVPPLARALCLLTFWADAANPRVEMAGSALVSAAVEMLRPEHPKATVLGLRRAARRHVWAVLNEPGSPIVWTYRERAARRHA